ncbi:amidase family protein, partial [Helcococcus bovis]|uniref:amidase family protein n=1 Tax=Helcococcus bovis TaxID=3153252 RepID=UPI0038BACEE5
AIILSVLLVSTTVVIASDANVKNSSKFVLDKEAYKKLSATQMAKLVKDGKVTAKQLVDLAYEVIEETDPVLNNIIKQDGKTINQALKDRAYADAENTANKDKPFFGVPILIKGLTFELENGMNSYGLEFMKDNISNKDNGLVKTYTDLGFIPIAQTTIPQMGLINVTNSNLFGSTKNPWNTEKNPGGSSGGSASGVAIGQSPVATANDAGGSIRIPASFSGLIGYFPSSGVVNPNTQLKSSSFTTENYILAEKMEDVTGIANALGGKIKANDLHLDKSKIIAYTTKTPAGTPISDEAISAVNDAVNFLKSKGYTLEEVEYPIDGKQMMMDYYINASKAGGISNYFFNQKFKKDMSKNDVELLNWGLYQLGKKLSPVDMKNAKNDLKNFRDKMDNFYEKYQAFITPTTSYSAPEADYNHIPEKLKDKMKDMSDLSKEEALQLIYDQWLPAWTITPFTQLSNVTDTPSISIPTHLTKDNMPLGVLISANRLNDNIILEMAELFENNNKFYLYQDFEEYKKYGEDRKVELKERQKIDQILEDESASIMEKEGSKVKLEDSNSSHSDKKSDKNDIHSSNDVLQKNIVDDEEKNKNINKKIITVTENNLGKINNENSKIINPNTSDSGVKTYIYIIEFAIIALIAKKIYNKSIK